ncbi:MAG: Ig-like domain repeat protein [Candidatus Acidiferrales bacterium]
MTIERIRTLRAAALVCVAFFSAAVNAAAQAPVISLSPGDAIHTVAGTGVAAFSGDNGAATSAALANPFSITADAAGNIYIADRDNHRVRRIDISGNITTVAGNGEQGFFGDGGLATSASLNTPTAVAVDLNGSIYIADSNNNRIRVVSNGTITTFAGNGNASYSGDGGAATSASLFTPRGVAVDTNGIVYIADTNNHVVRKVSGSTISTIAGNAQQQGFYGDNGTASSAGLDTPTSVVVDASGKVYVADSNNHRVRLLTGSTLSTFAGNGTAGFSGDGAAATSASIDFPLGISMDLTGNLYVADSNNHVVRRVGGAGTITTIAADGEQGFFGDSGAPNAASLDTPSGVLPLNGNVYIADLNNQRIRRVDATVLMFADQIVGTLSPVQSVTVTNSGNAALTLASAMPSSPSFALAASGTCGTAFPVNIPPSSNCTLDIVFDPSTVGPFNANFSVVNNAAGSPNLITVSGAGLQDGTTMAVVSSLPVSDVNVPVTFTATLTPTTATTAPTPTGTVIFTDGAANLGSGTISASVASFTTSALAAGSHTITATYGGDTLYTGSNANFVQKVIGPPNIQLVSSLNPSTPNVNVTFTVTVSSLNGTPTGTVIFNDGSTALSGALPIDGFGVAAFSTATLAAGTHPITAVYGGDANFSTVTSPVVTQRVEDYTISATPASASIKTGRSASFVVTVTPLGGFNSPVTLQCANLPLFASCDFAPATLTPNGTAVSSKLVVKTEMFQAQLRNDRDKSPLNAAWPLSILGLAGIVLLAGRRPRRVRKQALLWSTLTVVALFTLASCAGIPPAAISKTPPGDYTVTLNVSGNVGAVAEAHTINLTVTVTE